MLFIYEAHSPNREWFYENTLKSNYCFFQNNRDLLINILAITSFGCIISDIPYFTVYWFDDRGSRLIIQHLPSASPNTDSLSTLWINIAIPRATNDPAALRQSAKHDTFLRQSRGSLQFAALLWTKGQRHPQPFTSYYYWTTASC